MDSPGAEAPDASPTSTPLSHGTKGTSCFARLPVQSVPVYGTIPATAYGDSAPFASQRLPLTGTSSASCTIRGPRSSPCPLSLTQSRSAPIMDHGALKHALAAPHGAVPCETLMNRELPWLLSPPFPHRSPGSRRLHFDEHDLLAAEHHGATSYTEDSTVREATIYDTANISTIHGYASPYTRQLHPYLRVRHLDNSEPLASGRDSTEPFLRCSYAPFGREPSLM